MTRQAGTRIALLSSINHTTKQPCARIFTPQTNKKGIGGGKMQGFLHEQVKQKD